MSAITAPSNRSVRLRRASRSLAPASSRRAPGRESQAARVRSTPAPWSRTARTTRRHGSVRSVTAGARAAAPKATMTAVGASTPPSHRRDRRLGHAAGVHASSVLAHAALTRSAAAAQAAGGGTVCTSHASSCASVADAAARASATATAVSAASAETESVAHRRRLRKAAATPGAPTAAAARCAAPTTWKTAARCGATLLAGRRPSKSRVSVLTRSVVPGGSTTTRLPVKALPSASSFLVTCDSSNTRSLGHRPARARNTSRLQTSPRTWFYQCFHTEVYR